ncbi:MAG: DMT family transporter [Myxococcales bacterium]|nr:DMT family transporter [Myxococcales bacterium]
MDDRTARPPSAPTPGRGIVELVVAAVAFGVMAWLAKAATHHASSAQVAFVRFAVGTTAVLLWFSVSGAAVRVRRADLLLLRGGLGSIAVLAYFFAISRLPVGTATLYHYTAPIWTALFAALLLGERLPRTGAFALVLTFGGVALVVFGQGKALGGAYGDQALALGSAVISGGAVTAIRAARRYNATWTVFGAFSLLGLLVSAGPALATWRTPSLIGWLLLVSVGLVALLAQLLVTRALGHHAAATGGIISQLTVITALGLGTLIDNEPFGPLSLVGAIATLVGVSLAARVSTRTDDAPATRSERD